MSRKMILSLIIILEIIVINCNNNDETYEVTNKGEIDHIHEMGYAGNDSGLYYASHRRLKIYRDNKWFKTTTNLNDYMGFAAVDKGFYSSGHPGEDSNLPNPIGLQRSFDGGKTLKKISF